MPTSASDLRLTRAVRRVGSTGSTAVGKRLRCRCADHVKDVSSELGRNAPFIVLDGAELDIEPA